jgi:nucleotide-binding universal stress UspA family protein
MHCEHRTDRIRHHGRPPPAGSSDRRVVNGPGYLPELTDRRQPERTDRPGVETEEVGLTLLPGPRYRSLLVPLDGEGFGEHALPLALAIARRSSAAVRLVHVHRPIPVANHPEALIYCSGLDAWHRQRRQQYLNGLARRLAQATSVPVTWTILKEWDIADAVGTAAGGGTDLVVMATHGRGALGRLCFGSVADALLRRLSIPLLLVRGSDRPVDLTAAPPLRRVLIPLDGSKFAEQALEPALTLAALTGADHTALMVHDERQAATEIQRYAQAGQVDLVAVASRSRGGLLRLFRPSLADRVVRNASAPVLVVPAAQE